MQQHTLDLQVRDPQVSRGTARFRRVFEGDSLAAAKRAAAEHYAALGQELVSVRKAPQLRSAFPSCTRG